MKKPFPLRWSELCGCKIILVALFFHSLSLSRCECNICMTFSCVLPVPRPDRQVEMMPRMCWWKTLNQAPLSDGVWHQRLYDRRRLMGTLESWDKWEVVAPFASTYIVATCLLVWLKFNTSARTCLGVMNIPHQYEFEGWNINGKGCEFPSGM